MCGIAGIVGRPAGLGAVEAMAAAVVHRGPDDGGTWAEGDVALGFRRLAIIDLSPAGSQPMTSPSGRHVLVFNGEIYNHLELRDELQRAGSRFRGHSDTEVLLEAIERWGTATAVDRLNGMFAFAVWDRERAALTLARDRMGEKPLYYGEVGGAHVFASELKALRAVPGARLDVDRAALTGFLRFGYVPEPHSIVAGVRQVPPGATVELRGSPRAWQAPVRYWSPLESARRGLADPLPGSRAEAADAVHDLLVDSVAMRMVADVPVGAFLSGGVDSSLVVALMQEASGGKARTFSIGFDDPAFDEAHHARAVAEHLRTDHTDLYVTAEHALDVVPRLPDIYDEPFADSSQIPTFLVSELARRDVTVCLSGDGADELFGGYERYLLYGTAWRRLSRIPPGARRAAARIALAIPPSRWDAVGRRASGLVPRGFDRPRLGARIHKLAGALPVDDPGDAYHRLASHWDRPEDVVVGATTPVTAFTDPDRKLTGVGSIDTCMYLDMASYLPNDILTKVDRASMAVSLEVRVPFLDHRVVELAWRIPVEHKITDGRGKAVLCDLLARYVPPSLTDRPKTGFGVPLAAWLRGPLRDWAETLLDERRLREEGYLRPEPVRALWDAHQSGRADHQDPLWDVLSFQAWLERWSSGAPAACG